MSVNLCTYSYLKISCFNTTINVILNSTCNCLLLVYRNAVGSLGDGSDGKELAAHYKDLSFTAQLLYKKPARLCAHVIPVLCGQKQEDFGGSLTSCFSPFSGLQVQRETLSQNTS